LFDRDSTSWNITLWLSAASSLARRATSRCGPFSLESHGRYASGHNGLVSLLVIPHHSAVARRFTDDSGLCSFGIGEHHRKQYCDSALPVILCIAADTIATKMKRVSEQLGGVNRVSLQRTKTRLAHAYLQRGIELLGTESTPRV
jgi:hypothetical protein